MRRRIKIYLGIVIIAMINQLMSSYSYAQSPEKFSYQALVRNAANVILVNQTVGMRISIYQGSASGTLVYTETHTSTTNAGGIVALNIGAGTAGPENFSSIDWSNGPYYIITETDPAGGTSYSITGTQQLISVPYAMYAKTANYNDLENKPAIDGSETKVTAGVSISVSGSGTTLTPYSINFSIRSVTYDQKLALASPYAGQIIWCNNCGSSGELQVYNGTIWTNWCNGTASTAMPTVTTAAAGSIGATSATCGGNVTSDGGATVSARGVCWSTSVNPTITDSKSVDGSGTGSYSSSIIGLNPLTTYYVRAYATNVNGTSYGNQISFTTTVSLATVTTRTPDLITSLQARLGGDVTNEGGGTVTEKGICWSTSANPTTSSNKVIMGSGAGLYFATVNPPFTIGTTYHVRAYAINSAGTAYGSDIAFIALAIGDSWGGGKVAYINPTNLVNGFIAAPGDEVIGTVQWYNGSYTTTGATGTAIGTGWANTSAIVANQLAGTYAAKLCWDKVIGIYSDWYLPSREELWTMVGIQATLGGFTAGAYYWSSSELTANNALRVYFTGGTYLDVSKNLTYRVRAIRSF